MLRTSALSVSIAGLSVCRHMDVEVEAASRWAILGRNGVGKTTLLRAIAGLHPADEGSVSIGGRPIAEWSRRELARKTGMLFQDQATLFPGTVRETVLIGRHPYLDNWRWEDADDFAAAHAALAEVGLGGMEDRNLTTLSGGELQRLSIATLLCQAPALYLLDEPSNHLDPHHQIEVMNILCGRVRAAEGRAAVMVLHDVNLAARFCDHALLLYGDGITGQGRIGEILNVENLGRLYGHAMGSIMTAHGEFFFPE